jgi:hypothetical protein
VSATDVIVIVIVVVVVAVLAALAVRTMQRRKLRERFGDEYQRVVDEKGGRSAAEAELRRREKQHATLQLRDLDDADRVRFRDGWIAVQTLFVDDPVSAVRDGDRLVTELVAARGYPVSDYEDRLAHLSVEHANVLNHYRDAHEISTRNDAGKATTEELRQALVHYRELFADLLGERPVGEMSPGGAVASSAATEPSEPVAGTPVAPVAEAPMTTDADLDRDAELDHGVDRERGVPAAQTDAADADLAGRAGRADDTSPADAARTTDEPINGAPVGDSVQAGARGNASRRDASAPDTDADEA